MKQSYLGLVVILASSSTAVLGQAPALTAQDTATSAWRAGKFEFDVSAVVSNSNIRLGQPNLLASQAMPLGNGRLGVAVWSANGLTAQLNRSDTMPFRYSPGQVVIPGLAVLTSAKDYSGQLNLFDGSFEETGAGMTATVYVQPHTDTLIVDVTGADPGMAQTAQLKLWSPRPPVANFQGTHGTLSQTWIDDRGPGASKLRFGCLAAITAQAQDVSVVVSDQLTISVTFKPESDGHFRVIVGAPQYNGSGEIAAIAEQAFSELSPVTHKAWWNAFWQRSGIIKVASPDGTGEYLENLRNINLFTAAASSSGTYPGSHAGVADLFSSVQDDHHWDPAAFWHWNLRMQVAANLAAGLPELNAPYFRLYRDNLRNIQNWTAHHMGHRPGICVPETMRFNGQGFEYEAGWGRTSAVTGLNCDSDSEPYYNARTLSTGAEVSLWIWQQYLATNDLQFLAENYPVMAAAARFLLAYQKRGHDGLEHTSPSNAHETQWDAIDPTTDLAARMALYPAAIEAATLLGQDSALVQKLKEALPKIPPFPRTQAKGSLALVSASDHEEQDVIASSYEPAAPTHNFENIGLEPVWPYNLIGDTSPLFALAKRTYQSRPFPMNQDWSFDPLQAARLGLGDEASSALIQLTKRYQTFVNGFANWGGTNGEFYGEQGGIVSATLPELLVQDYDGLLRIAPAAPAGWNFDGVVFVRANTEVCVQVRSGIPVTVAIQPGINQDLHVRNPWRGQAVEVIDAGSNTKRQAELVNDVLTFPATAGTTYSIRKSGTPALPFAPVTDTPPTTLRKMDPVQIGLPGRS